MNKSKTLGGIFKRHIILLIAYAIAGQFQSLQFGTLEMCGECGQESTAPS